MSISMYGKLRKAKRNTLYGEFRHLRFLLIKLLRGLI